MWMQPQQIQHNMDPSVNVSLVESASKCLDKRHLSRANDPLPVCVWVVVHEPRPVVVHVHCPGLVVLPQHHILQDVPSGDPKRRVGVVVVSVDGHLPVVQPSGEGRVPHHHAVVVAVARHRQVVVGEQDVGVSRGGVKGEPGDCAQTVFFSHI